MVPARESVEAFAREQGIEFSDYEGLLKDEKIRSLFDDIVKKNVSTAKGFRACERIGKVALISRSFEVGVELSAKQEMMRHKIAEIYRDEIAALFD